MNSATAQLETKANSVATPPFANHLIVMTRYPEPGRTKTRLIPAIGKENAAFLHQQLIQQTRETVHQLLRKLRCKMEVHYTGCTQEQMETLFEDQATCISQQGNSLGEKMHAAIKNAFAQGAKKVIVIGTDCPDIEPKTLINAFNRLDESNAVIGPAFDGGYFLIGLNQPNEAIFNGVEWGTETVLEQTIENCKDCQFKISQLAPLSDVDYPEDLIVCRRKKINFQIETNDTKQMTKKISVIIPTLNEETGIERTLQPLLGNDQLEIIIVDGGSTDQTVNRVESLGVKVIKTNPGRGKQLNAGAAIATAETLLFLHADTTLPKNFAQHVCKTLEQGAIAGAFQLHIKGKIFGKRMVERAANWRSKHLQMPYGDQAIFIRAEDFYQNEGFKNWSIMEDYEFCRRLRKKGKIEIVPCPATTSGRRWEKLGVLKNTFKNQLCIIAYHLGVSPKKIANFYREKQS